MTPAEFRAVRLALGLTLEQWGRALGYTGKTVRQHIHNMETGHPKAPIRPWIARLARMYERFGIPADFPPIS